MVELLSDGKRVVNIDETWLNETNFIRNVWAEKKGKGNLTLRAVQPRISMITAIDTQGSIWFALTQANTDSNVMITFLKSLSERLDNEHPGW